MENLAYLYDKIDDVSAYYLEEEFKALSHSENVSLRRKFLGWKRPIPSYLMRFPTYRAMLMSFVKKFLLFK
jgi:hypothetical protein